jgi:hypothetical protein
MRYSFLRLIAVALWLASEAAQTFAVVDTAQHTFKGENDAAADGRRRLAKPVKKPVKKPARPVKMPKRPAGKPTAKPPSKCSSLQASITCAIDVGGAECNKVDWANTPNFSNVKFQLALRNTGTTAVTLQAINYTLFDVTTRYTNTEHPAYEGTKFFQSSLLQGPIAPGQSRNYSVPAFIENYRYTVTQNTTFLVLAVSPGGAVCTKFASYLILDPRCEGVASKFCLTVA